MKQPRINILIRTSGRPNYFKDCIKSVLKQDYDNICLIINFDNPDSIDYIEPYSHEILKRFPDNELLYSEKTPRDLNLTKNIDGNICYHAPYNLYFNKMQSVCKSGYIMYLDDDDMFTKEDSVSIIAKHTLFPESGKVRSSCFINWIVDVAGRKIPSENNKGKIVAGDIGGSIAFPVAKKHLAEWSEYSFGDFRVISQLSKECDLVFIDDVLTKTQNRQSTGNFGKIIDKKTK